MSTIAGETVVATAARTIDIATFMWLLVLKYHYTMLLNIVAAVEIIITISYANMIEEST